MDILIVTYYFVNSNYGAVYQAYALGEYLRQIGHRVAYWGKKELEDYAPEDYYSQKKKKVIQNYRENWIIDRRFDKEYDVAIVGSDQVWGGFEPWFWGENLPARKVIAYAPAVGNLLTSKNKWKAIIKSFFGEYQFYKHSKKLKNFACLCARDIETKRLVEKYVHEKVPLVLDPTFLIDWTKEIVPVTIDKPYVLVYSYGLSPEYENYVKTYAKKKELKVVIVNYESGNADYNDVYSPQEVLGLYSGAHYVITDSFHGTAFSLIFKKNFVVLKKGHRTKPYFLLKQLECEQRYVESVESATKIIDKPVDYKNVTKIIDKYRQSSIEYLSDSLK